MSMYSRLVTVFVAVAALTTLAPVRAQDARLIARVPFEFAVGDTSLPRDTYYLSRMDNHREMVLLRSERKGVFVRVMEERVPRNGGTPSLVFHRYGDQYFLREIRWEETARFDLPETKAEHVAAEGRPDRAAASLKKVIIPAGR